MKLNTASVVLILLFSATVMAINPSEVTQKTTLSVDEKETVEQSTEHQLEEEVMIIANSDADDSQEEKEEEEGQEAESSDSDVELEDFWFRRRRRRFVPQPTITVDNVWNHLQAIESKCRIPAATGTKPMCRAMVNLDSCPKNLNYFLRVVAMKRHCGHLPEVKALYKIATAEPLKSCKYRCDKKLLSAVPRPSFFVPTEAKIRNRVIPRGQQQNARRWGAPNGRVQDEDEQQGEFTEQDFEAFAKSIDEHNAQFDEVDRGMMVVDGSESDEEVNDHDEGIASWFSGWRRKGWWKCFGW
eukprot:TRINITY_DN5733_c0_g1_i1.p1 TRINITY_DN5733_c0_g1~~TRINITY_DN5733_c0_g1_i1.p1  ORF type:complete len:299 (+),score=92.97 TRINITY_DN5733_c0_g1_i1:1-897(+)